MVGDQENPVVQHRRLRAELRRMRQLAKLTQRDVAQAMDWSTSKLVRIESGEVGISSNDLRMLLRHYGVRDRQLADELVEMARNARKDMWKDYRDVYSLRFLRFVGNEASARIIRGYDSLLIPGLLQTEAYAREVLTYVGQGSLGYAGEDLPVDVVERRWHLRRQRQLLHERDDPPKMSFVLDEAVIRRQIGGPEIMSHQLRQLCDWQRRPHVTVRVLPFEIGAYRGMRIPFMMLDFMSDDDDLLYLEDNDERETRIADDPARTGIFIDIFLGLEERALSPEESDELIAEATREMESRRRA
jgi:transcriptional regulator with XRE-family HTH domain